MRTADEAWYAVTLTVDLADAKRLTEELKVAQESGESVTIRTGSRRFDATIKSVRAVGYLAR